MGHLVDAIKKLEQRRVIEEATPAPPARAKSTRKRTRRVDPPHPVAALPRGVRRGASRPPAEGEPTAAFAPPPEAIAVAAATIHDAGPVIADVATADAGSIALVLLDVAPVETAADPIAQVVAAPAEKTSADDLPTPAPQQSESSSQNLSVVKPAQAIERTPAAIPATIARDPIEAPTTAAAAASPPAVEPTPTLRLLVEDEPTTPAAEQTPMVWEIPTPNIPSDYRELAAMLSCPAIASRPVRSVLVTGVSLAAIEAISLPALAAALAVHGSVLWIDPKRRRPISSPACSDGDDIPGLHELVAGEARWDEAIRQTSLGDVWFVGCGGGPTGTRGERSMAAGLESLPEGFSLVLVDGGLAEESALLAAVCESVGLAVALGRDRRGEIEGALAALANVGAIAPLMIALG